MHGQQNVRYYPILENAQTGWGVRPTWYPVNSIDTSYVGKPEDWTHLVPMIRMRTAVPPIPRTFSWCDAYINTGTTSRDFRLPLRSGLELSVVWDTIILRHFHRPQSSLYTYILRFGATGFLLDSWTLRMGPISYSEMSVRNYHYSPRNNPEERSSQWQL